MKLTVITAALTLALTATAAQAAPTIVWDAGSGTMPTNMKTIEDFDGLTANTAIGTNAYALDGNSGIGARPAFGSTGNYGSVLTGGTYKIGFNPASILSFVVGSLDTYNSLELFFADKSSIKYSGSQIISMTPPPPYADGNQGAAYTNGVVSYHAGKGPKITGATFSSGGNSFEFDKISVNSAVPEPGTWAMLIAGFSVMGMALRLRRQPKVAFAA